MEKQKTEFDWQVKRLRVLAWVFGGIGVIAVMIGLSVGFLDPRETAVGLIGCVGIPSIVALMLKLLKIP
jgi:hypothetical protein